MEVTDNKWLRASFQQNLRPHGTAPANPNIARAKACRHKRNLEDPIAVPSITVEEAMSDRKLNPNKIPEAHVEEDKNTPGDDSGDQSENITRGDAPTPAVATPRRRKLTNGNRALGE